MPTAPTCTLALNEKRSVTITAYDRDGNLDETSPLAAVTNQPAIATIAVDAANPRKFWIAGAAQTGMCAVSIDTIPASPGAAVLVPVSVTPAVNRAHVDFVAFGPPEPR